MYNLKLFGDQFEVTTPEGNVLVIQPNVPGVLLARLAAQSNGRCSREALSTLLWPYEDPAAARGRLRTTVHRLRDLLGDDPPLIVDRVSIGFDWSLVTSDVAEFSLGMSKARRLTDAYDRLAVLGAGFKHYTGPLLSQFSTPWAAEKRDEKRTELIEGLVLAGRLASEVGDLAGAVSFLSQARTLDPLNEPVILALIEASERAAGSQSALRIIDEYRAVLKRELDFPPSNHVLNLERRLAQLSGPTAPQRAPRPVSYNTLIGRDELVTEIQDSLEQHSLVTLAGIGGSGKTRLAIEIYRKGLSLNPRFIDLTSVQTEDELVQTMVEAFQPTPFRVSDPRTWLMDALREQQPLLVLDNSEHLLEPIGRLVSDVGLFCPNVAVLVTSRKRLGVQHECVIEVNGLDFPDETTNLSPEEASSVPAFQMFVTAAQRTDRRFKLTEENLHPISEILKSVDALPLAIELAAARLRLMTAQELRDRTAKNLEILSTSQGPERQRKMTAIVAWSMQNLSASALTLLERLSIFAGGWSIEAAALVISDLVSGEAEAADCLEELVQAALVQRNPRGRFKVLESIRATAMEQLQGSGRVEDARERHLRAYVELLGSLSVTPDSNRRVEWMQRLTDELPNVRTALQWATTRTYRDQMGAKLILSIWRFWINTSSLPELLDYTRAISALDPQNEPNVVSTEFHWAVAELETRMGYYDRAGAAASAALEISRKLRDLELEATSLLRCAELELHKRNTVRARETYLVCARMFIELNDALHAGDAMQGVAFTYTVEADHAAAIGAYLEALRYYEKSGDAYAVASVLSNIGAGESQTGDSETAYTRLAHSLELLRDYKTDRIKATLLINLGHIQVERGYLEDARAYYEAGHEMQKEIGEPRRVARSEMYLGTLFLIEGDLEYARRQLMIAYERFHLLNEKEEGAVAALWLARVALAREDLLTAGNHLSEALSVLANSGPATDCADALELAAALCAANHNPESAAWLLGAAEGIRSRLSLVAPRLKRELSQSVEAMIDIQSAAALLQARREGSACEKDHALKRALWLSVSEWKDVETGSQTEHKKRISDG